MYRITQCNHDIYFSELIRGLISLSVNVVCSWNNVCLRWPNRQMYPYVWNYSWIKIGTIELTVGVSAAVITRLYSVHFRWSNGWSLCCKYRWLLEKISLPKHAQNYNIADRKMCLCLYRWNMPSKYRTVSVIKRGVLAQRLIPDTGSEY